jgi:hypothetical protein
MVTARGLSWVLKLLLSALFLISPMQAEGRDQKLIFGADANGVGRWLPVDRTPALYTGDFGDCLGGQSLFNITKFDAAYYADNLTIVFHLDGTTNVKNESLMSEPLFSDSPLLTDSGSLLTVPAPVHIAVDACKSPPGPESHPEALTPSLLDGESRFTMTFDPCFLNIYR